MQTTFSITICLPIRAPHYVCCPGIIYETPANIWEKEDFARFINTSVKRFFLQNCTQELTIEKMAKKLGKLNRIAYKCTY